MGHMRDVQVKIKFSWYFPHFQKEKLSEVQVHEHRGSSTAFGNYQIIWISSYRLIKPYHLVTDKVSLNSKPLIKGKGF